MNAMPKILILAISLFAVSCNEIPKRDNSADYADDIYFGGDIITMERDSETFAEAVAIFDFFSILLLLIVNNGNTLIKLVSFSPLYADDLQN